MQTEEVVQYIILELNVWAIDGKFRTVMRFETLGSDKRWPRKRV